MSESFNKLTPAQTERLGKLIEEMGEALQIAGKIMLHGYASHHPDAPLATNKMLLEKELGDICAAIKLLTDRGDLDDHDIYLAAKKKDPVITRYMHHQED